MKQGYSQLQVDLASKVKIYTALKKMIEGTDQEKQEEVQKLINIPAGELHCTLMYDKRDPDLNPGYVNKVYKATVTGVERMGTPGGKYYSLALILECDEIQERFKALQEIGFEHSWPDLKLHISLNYGSDVNVMYQIVKDAFDQGKLPSTIRLGLEAWNECK